MLSKFFFYIKVNSRWFFKTKYLYYWRKIASLCSKLWFIFGGVIYLLFKYVAIVHVTKSSCVVWGDKRLEWVFWELISNTLGTFRLLFPINSGEFEYLVPDLRREGMKTSSTHIAVCEQTSKSALKIRNVLLCCVLLFWSKDQLDIFCYNEDNIISLYVSFTMCFNNPAYCKVTKE